MLHGWFQTTQDSTVYIKICLIIYCIGISSASIVGPPPLEEFLIQPRAGTLSKTDEIMMRCPSRLSEKEKSRKEIQADRILERATMAGLF